MEKIILNNRNINIVIDYIKGIILEKVVTATEIDVTKSEKTTTSRIIGVSEENFGHGYSSQISIKFEDGTIHTVYNGHIIIDENVIYFISELYLLKYIMI